MKRQLRCGSKSYMIEDRVWQALKGLLPASLLRAGADLVPIHAVAEYMGWRGLYRELNDLWLPHAKINGKIVPWWWGAFRGKPRRGAPTPEEVTDDDIHAVLPPALIPLAVRGVRPPYTQETTWANLADPKTVETVETILDALQEAIKTACVLSVD